MSNTVSESGPLFGSAVTAQQENPNGVGLSYDAYWEVAEAPTLQLNWNKVFPYQFLIVERVGGKWQRTRNPDIPGPLTLPIPPQTLSIDMPFASTVEATQGGIVEQNNGAPFREIVLSGTTGVLPLRGTTQKPSGFGLARGIFAGTVNAAQSVLAAASTVRNATQILTAEEQPNVNPESEFEGALGTSTGYYQFLLLKRLLEWYASAKKGSKAQNFALAFAVWKEREVYLVTPVKFGVTRQAGKGLHYMYNIALKAWRRVVLSDGSVGSLASHEFAARNPNLYAQVLSSIDIARRTLENSRKVLQAVRADVNNVVFESLRQVTLFVKDAINTSFAVADLPKNLIADFKQPLLEKIGATGLGNIPSPSDVAASLSIRQEDLLKDRLLANLLNELAILAALSQKSKTGAGSSSSSQALTDTSNQRGASKVLDIFVNPENYYNFWGSIRYDNLALRPSTVNKIDVARLAVVGLKRSDFETIRDNLLEVAADYANSVGVGDPTYNATYGIPVRTPVRTSPTDSDWEVLGALNDAAQQLDALAASSTIERKDNISAVDYVAGLARASGLAFTTPKSKYLVPFPYGYTLEQLANQYLGAPDRWIEIATLNGLRAPYVDELGTIADFATPGSGNQVTLPKGPYFVGQPAWISALGEKREKRRIQRIDTISDQLVTLTLSGSSDLHRFTPAKEATLQVFLPDTVNSLMYLYIPSDDETETDWQTKSIPGVDSFDPLFRVGGADLLLTDSGDLAITSDGTTRLAVGLTNLIQRVKIAVGTPQGSLMHHPEFGFGVIPGTSTSDVTASQVLAAAKNFVKREEGFDGVEYAAVRKSGNALTLSMAVRIAGVNKTIPISVDLR